MSVLPHYRKRSSKLTLIVENQCTYMLMVAFYILILIVSTYYICISTHVYHCLAPSPSLTPSFPLSLPLLSSSFPLSLLYLPPSIPPSSHHVSRDKAGAYPMALTTFQWSHLSACPPSPPVVLHTSPSYLGSSTSVTEVSYYITQLILPSLDLLQCYSLSCVRVYVCTYVRMLDIHTFLHTVCVDPGFLDNLQLRHPGTWWNPCDGYPWRLL